MGIMDTEKIYKGLGISREVWEYGQRTESRLKERFEEFDKNAEYNQMKVIRAMQENRVSEGCCKRIAIVVNSHIERLGISSKLACLQITPLVANGSQGALLAIKRYLHRLRKRGLVVNIK